jgi:hypothetical protein
MSLESEGKKTLKSCSRPIARSPLLAFIARSPLLAFIACFPLLAPIARFPLPAPIARHEPHASK